MTEKRKKLETHTSPKGTFKFPYLNKPDTGPKDGSFQMEPSYRVTLVLEPAEAAPLVKKLNAQWTEHEKAMKKEDEKREPVKRKKNPFKMASKPWKPELDEQGEETGNTELNFKMLAQSKLDDGTVITRKPALFDAKGKKVVGAKVGGGTVGKISFNINPFPFKPAVGAGISLRLLAAQIIDLKEFGERSAQGYGFGEEEGYEAPKGGEESAEDKDESTDEGETKEELAF